MQPENVGVESLYRLGIQLVASFLKVLLGLDEVRERRVQNVTHRRDVVRAVGDDLAGTLELALTLVVILREVRRVMLSTRICTGGWFASLASD